MCVRNSIEWKAPAFTCGRRQGVNVDGPVGNESHVIHEQYDAMLADFSRKRGALS